MSELGPSPLTRGERQLSVDEARAAVAAAITAGVAASGPSKRAETLPLLQASGRVLAADLPSPIDVPAHDNSAMDGFAFDGSALAAGASPEFDVAGILYAGPPWSGTLGPGQCLRIMTGAVMPAGADTVVPFELAEAVHTSADGAPTRVRVPAGTLKRGENRRRRGEDLAAGRAALPAGRWLRPADVGLAASLGFTSLAVRPRLKVALFSTGDEIAAPGTPLAEGQIYDSNRFTLGAALARLPVEVLDLGLVRDDPAALEATLRRAAAEADVVLTSGGVSAGDADHTREVLARLGEVAFWKVAMRPGRPFAFGPLHRVARGHGHSGAPPAMLFALPGNPVAALVTFYAFVREPLLALAGAAVPPRPSWRVPCAVPIRKRPGRTEYQRGIVERGAVGTSTVRPFEQQGAGILRSMSEANALIVLGHAQGPVAAGDLVDVWPFDGLV